MCISLQISMAGQIARLALPVEQMMRGCMNTCSEHGDDFAPLPLKSMTSHEALKLH